MIGGGIRRLGVLLLTLSLGWAAGAPAQEAVRGQVGALRYEAPPGYAELAQRLTTEADRDLADAHRWLGLDRGQGAIPDPQPGILYWVRNRQELAARLGREEVPDWYAAVARPLQGDMILAVEVAGGDVAVELDAASAAEGDTFLQSASRTYAGSAEYDVAGWDVDADVDMNGDGFSDLLVGASGADRGGESEVGSVHLIYGPLVSP